MASQGTHPQNINDFDFLTYDSTLGDGSLNTTSDSLNDTFADVHFQQHEYNHDGGANRQNSTSPNVRTMVPYVLIDVRARQPWRTDDLQQMRQETRRAERRWRRTRLVVHREIYTDARDAFNFKRRIASAKSAHYCAMIESSACDIKSIPYH